MSSPVNTVNAATALGTNSMPSTPDFAKQFYELGRKSYNISFEISRNFFMGSLYACFVQAGILSQDLDLKADQNFHPFIDPLLLTSSSEAIVQKVLDTQTTDQQRFIIAQTLRWLGHCYQNINVFSGMGKDNDTRFEFLYGTAEKLLLLDPSEEAKMELAELYYNTGAFMHLRKNPGDYSGAAECCNRVLAFNGSEAMKARIANLQARYCGVLMTADIFYEKVFKPYCSLAQEQRDPYLFIQYHNNYAKYLFNEGRLDEAETYYGVVLAYLNEQERSEAPSLHAYFGIFYTNIAALKTAQGKTGEAIQLLQRAAEHNSRNPGTKY